MHTQRAATLLQGVAEVRNWVVRHIPLTGSLVGYDLFLILGHAYLQGTPVRLSDLDGKLAYAGEAVVAQLQAMADAGLIVPSGSGPATLLAPSARFAELIDEYARIFEHNFIPRSSLRGEQLHLGVMAPALRTLAEQLYDRCYDLGWLYHHHFGSACYMMATLLTQLVRDHGHAARVEVGYLELEGAADRFVIGGAGSARPGQIDGHAWCVVNEEILLDYGMGSGRRFYRRDLCWGAALPYQPGAGCAAAAMLPGGVQARWRNDWRTPHADPELAACIALLPPLRARYHDIYGPVLSQ